jgi:putative spermidine/putrescine transport system ATP-binding protein
VRRLQKTVGTTAAYVTHDQEEALAIADAVVLMNAGRVVQSGSPQEIYSRPERAFTAEFLGVSNQLAGIAAAGGVSVGAQRLPYAGPVRGPAVLIVRATDASLATDRGEAELGHALLDGVLEERFFLGSVYRHYIRVDDETVLVDRTEPVEPGPVTVRVPVAKVQVFAA